MTETTTEPRRRNHHQVLIWTIGLTVTGVMLFLGLWQMSVFRTQGREALEARTRLPPVPITSVATTREIPKDAYGRPVEAHGRYVTGADILVPDPRAPERCRILSPLRLSDGNLVPVVRGVSPTCTPTPLGSDPREEIGVFLPSEAEPERELPPGKLGTVRLPRVAQAWEGDMLPGFVVLDAGHATEHGLEPAVVTMPDGAGNARSSGYALQWWIFAAAAVAATVKISRDSARNRGLMGPPLVAVDNSVEN